MCSHQVARRSAPFWNSLPARVNNDMRSQLMVPKFRVKHGGRGEISAPFHHEVGAALVRLVWQVKKALGEFDILTLFLTK